MRTPESGKGKPADIRVVIAPVDRIDQPLLGYRLTTLIRENEQQ
jgi:hypothetical protein